MGRSSSPPRLPSKTPWVTVMVVLSVLAARWREDAETLTGHGCVSESKICLKHADQLEATLQDWESEVLTIKQASEESGYSESRLRELAREGKLPADREPGSQGPIKIRRGDLPRRPGRSRQSSSDLDEYVQGLVER